MSVPPVAFLHAFLAPLPQIGGEPSYVDSERKGVKENEAHRILWQTSQHHIIKGCFSLQAMKGRGGWLLLPAVMSLSCLPLTSTSTSPMPSPASPSMLAFALHTPMRFCTGVSTARRVGGSRGGLREATPRPGSRRNGKISLPELRLARSSSASSARLGSENPKATAAPASPSEKDEGKGKGKEKGKEKGKGKAKAKGKDQAEPGKAIGACGVWRWSLSPPDKTGGANDVATFRHVEHGIGIELWQGSFGWFDFVPRVGEDVMLCDSWAVQIKRNVKHFSMHAQWEALGEEISRGGGGTLEPGSPSFKVRIFTAAHLFPPSLPLPPSPSLSFIPFILFSPL
jgi:hypothetical protein